MLAKLNKEQVTGYYEDKLDAQNAIIEIEGFDYSPSYVFKTINPEGYEVGLRQFVEYLKHNGYEVEGF